MTYVAIVCRYCRGDGKHRYGKYCACCRGPSLDEDVAQFGELLRLVEDAEALINVT